MYAGLHTCVHVYMCVHVSGCMCMCDGSRVCACMCICACVQVRVCMSVCCACVCVYMCECMCVHARVCTCVCACVCMGVQTDHKLPKGMHPVSHCGWLRPSPHAHTYSPSPSHLTPVTLARRPVLTKSLRRSPSFPDISDTLLTCLHGDHTSRSTWSLRLYRTFQMKCFPHMINFHYTCTSKLKYCFCRRGFHTDVLLHQKPEARLQVETGFVQPDQTFYEK